ncbi:MAG: Veg family protein [Ezakiella sp.]|nr:Veg family protein [Ezakiella sp.]MDD7472486.1 Veg family protein [Bacillota bacterium]MDY3923271.1 Veg family protein [Ezakiella sp.]
MQNINNIKRKIATLVGETVELETNHGRNNLERVEGKIVNAYPGIFTFEYSLSDTNDNITSFSYSDVLCNKVKIIEV